ncbi:4-galactosyl-N-acetylglucosaminide 3-alpha-L-fucosyltransferase 9-like isoform X2 [Periophthalmus magnuspinnatus]|uniref:4-galactosyl-N-acetylglucosaminide 3-alpha-L-fucosyltransferase 9-like isoform X2 n=1 Tax=Periophthalmus magnuspinnatus TaxID=409849 RepID=UPI0024371E33|nr:4-galactosyl-N-acetylglucosaminide 3-alpha-L-fucosyltransferase 9-like isoform X2 [Periophthalmus magnuspinnatus]
MCQLVWQVMSSSIWFSAHLRILVLVLIIVTVALLFLGYNSENPSTIGFSPLPQNSVINCSNVREERKSQDPILLIWVWPFGHKFDLNCDPFDITGCKLTDDRSLYPTAHAVIFHHDDIDVYLQPKEPRPSFQLWVWFNMESPSNSNRISGFRNLFNLTCSYRRDSDIFTPYGSLVPVSNDKKPCFRLPTKDKLVCWIVCNWNSHFKRVQYFNELKKHVEIKTYSRAFGEYISNEMYVEIITSCKFYLSFENSIHKDYITEKFYMPLKLGAVPVVLGPPRENYEAHAPAESFIHVDDFASPKELAERLQHLHLHPDQYMDYFEWRNSFKAVSGIFGLEQVCRTCHYLKTQRRYQSVRDLNKWYWDN